MVEGLTNLQRLHYSGENGELVGNAEALIRPSPRPEEALVAEALAEIAASGNGTPPDRSARAALSAACCLQE